MSKIGLVWLIFLFSWIFAAQPDTILKSAGHNYFPVAKGNWWQYSKISNGEMVFVLETITIKDARNRIVRDTQGHFDVVYDSVGPTATQETYAILQEQGGRYFMDINSADTLNQRVRDYRYKDAVAVALACQEDVPQVAAAWSESIIKMVNSDTLISIHRRPVVFIPDSIIPGKKLTAKTDSYLQFVIETLNFPVTVPAGTFSDCLKFSVTVSPIPTVDIVALIHKNKPVDLAELAREFPHLAGWQTTSVFAPGVGMILEEQTDYKGDINYRLLLTDYHIK